MKLAELLSILHSDIGVEIFFDKDSGKLSFYCKNEISDFWKEMEIVEDTLEIMDSDAITLTMRLPEKI